MKFTPRNETTRQFIIETTAPIFNTKGYAGTSMSDLTEATKLTKGSIYGNFENKEEVALAAFEYNASLRMDVIKARVKTSITNKEKLLVYATIYNSKQSQAYTVGGCPFMNTATEADDTNEVMRQKVAECFMYFKKDIAGIIRKGITAGEFAANVDANKMAWSVIALMEGAILIGKTTKSAANLDLVLNTIKDMIEAICLT